MKLFALALALLLPSMAAAPDIMGNAFRESQRSHHHGTLQRFPVPRVQEPARERPSRTHAGIRDAGKVYLIQRYFPLQGHPYGLLSAQYVCAASRVGKFEQASNILFATQPVWSGERAGGTDRR